MRVGTLPQIEKPPVVRLHGETATEIAFCIAVGESIESALYQVRIGIGDVGDALLGFLVVRRQFEGAA